MHGAPLVLRPATVGDAEAVASLVHGCFETYRAFAGPGWSPPTLEWSAADFERRLPGLGVRTRVAMPAAGAVPAAVETHPTGARSGGVAAAAICGWMPARDRSEPRQPIPGLAHLWLLFVAPSRWGTGLAAQLLGWAVAGMAEAGYDAARLWTPTGQARARAFYERRGWRPTGVGQHGEDLRLDLVEYRRALA